MDSAHFFSVHAYQAEITLMGLIWLQGDQTSPSKGNQFWIFIGRTGAEAETPILWPPDAKNWITGKDPDAGKDWRQEEKGMAEDEMVGWLHQLDGHEFEQSPGVGDGQGSLACCSPWGCKDSDTTEWLNWTEPPYGKRARNVGVSAAFFIQEYCNTITPWIQLHPSLQRLHSRPMLYHQWGLASHLRGSARHLPSCCCAAILTNHKPRACRSPFHLELDELPCHREWDMASWVPLKGLGESPWSEDELTSHRVSTNQWLTEDRKELRR